MRKKNKDLKLISSMVGLGGLAGFTYSGGNPIGGLVGAVGGYGIKKFGDYSLKDKNKRR